MEIDYVNLKDVEYPLQLEVRNWRNAEHITKHFQIPYIDLETHEKWLKSLTLENPENIAFLIKVEDDFVGLVYFTKVNYQEKSTNWGIYIYKKNYQGKGLGQKVLTWSFDYAKNTLMLKKIKLEVLKENIWAIPLYEKNGFKYASQKNTNVLCYELEL